MVQPRGLNSGMTWLLYRSYCTLFTVNLPPGSSIPDCGSDGASNTGCLTARSYHPGGVVAALADGSARWFGNTVSMNVCALLERATTAIEVLSV